MKTFCVAIVATFTAACGYGIKTASDYDRSIDFARYTTFSLTRVNPSGDPLFDRCVTDDIREALVSRGWVEAPARDARATVLVHVATETKHSYSSYYEGWGGWGWRVDRLGTTAYVEDHRVGTVAVDIFDTETKRIMWRGSATDTIADLSKSDAQVTAKSIAKMFNRFPVGPKASFR